MGVEQCTVQLRWLGGWVAALDGRKESSSPESLLCALGFVCIHLKTLHVTPARTALLGAQTAEELTLQEGRCFPELRVGELPSGDVLTQLSAQQTALEGAAQGRFQRGPFWAWRVVVKTGCLWVGAGYSDRRGEPRSSWSRNPCREAPLSVLEGR